MLKLCCALLLLPVLLKARYVDDFIFHYTTTRLLGFSQVLANDALFYGVMLCLCYLSLLPQLNRLLKGVCRLIALSMLVLYVADYVVIVNFNTHLTVGDSIKYASYAYQYLQQIYGLSSVGLALLALVLLACLLALLLHGYQLPAPPKHKLPLALGLCFPLAAGFADGQKYAHSWIYSNVVGYNLTILSESAPYSDAFSRALNYQETLSCQDSPRQQKNIILLMVESLSAYQSQYFSGLQDWTPQLDAIARQNQAFKNFYANGFITEDGEIALLTGVQPLYPPSSYNDDGGTSFYSFYGLPSALPVVLRPYGYHSEFLTTADLEFGNTGAWAKSTGFDYIEGHDHPDYDRWERFHFKSAPDAALYQRALARVQQQTQPYLLFIKTVSSHHPYVNPENKHASEAETIQYTDKQIGHFYQQLQANGFFKQGILIIVGDHHSMTPLKAGEVEHFGQYQAAAKVPLVIADGTTVQETTQPFQQIDVYNSLQAMVTGSSCYSDWRGLLYGSDRHAPRYILHRRGDNRDQVSVFTPESDFLIKLDGDATHILNQGQLDASSAQSILAKINSLRIARAAWAKQWAETAH